MRRKRLPDLERILGKLDVADCWEWTGYQEKDGYGRSHTGYPSLGTFKTVLVHRFVYEQLTGCNLNGLQLDHLCKNRKCANPDHLEPVSLRENIRRGATGKWQRRKAA